MDWGEGVKEVADLVYYKSDVTTQEVQEDLWKMEQHSFSNPPLWPVSSICSSVRPVFSQKKNRAPLLIVLGSPASASALSLCSVDLSDASHSLSLPQHDIHHTPVMPLRDPPMKRQSPPSALDPQLQLQAPRRETTCSSRVWPCAP